MPGVGDFVLFFSTQWPEFCTEKLSLGRGFSRKTLAKGSALGGGTVISQTDTCITSTVEVPLR